METNVEVTETLEAGAKAWAAFLIVLTIMVIGLYTIVRWIGRHVIKAAKFLFNTVKVRFT